MYIPRRYEEKDISTIHAFIRENSFAILVSVSDGVPVATHIPLLLEKNNLDEEVLVGHISKGNNQKTTLYPGSKVLCIFPGPHAYISPRWYTELNVPTWNYIAVHVYGTISLMEGDELKSALSRLVDYFEHPLPQPMKMEEIPEKTLRDDLRGIIGFQIKIEEYQAAYKMSQNRDETSYHQVTDKLSQSDFSARQLAEEMNKKKDALFGKDNSV